MSKYVFDLLGYIAMIAAAVAIIRLDNTTRLIDSLGRNLTAYLRTAMGTA
jgi:hypothetical protein